MFKEIDSVGDLAGTLKDIAAMVRGASEQWTGRSDADSLTLAVPGYPQYEPQQRLLTETITQAEHDGLIADISPHLRTDCPSHYFNDFMRLVETRFARWSHTPPPVRYGPTRWAWALDLAAEGIWREMGIKPAPVAAPPVQPLTPPKPRFTIASLRELTGMGNTALNKYARMGGVKTPNRGKRNHKYTANELQTILQTVVSHSSSEADVAKCKAALRNL